MYTISDLKRIFTPEEMLTVLLCRLHFKKATREEVVDHLNGSGINFSGFDKIISTHGIRPFIYSVIIQHSIEIDTVLADKLKTHFETNRIHGFEKLVWIKKLAAQFSSVGITVIPLKGVLFAEHYYSNIALRESSDIDFLITADDVEKVEQIIIENGFKEKMSVPASFMNYYKKHFKEIVYVIPSAYRKRGYTLEIHWRLLNKYMGGFPGFIFFKKGLASFSAGQLQFEKLTPQYDLLTLISNHFAKDLSVKFKYLIDVACLINQCEDQLDVKAAKELVTKHHCLKKTGLGLSLTAKLLGIELKGWEMNTSFPDKYSLDALRVPVVLKRFLILNGAFLRRSLALQDNIKQRLLFLSRCIGYMMLPTPNDIHLFRKLPLFIMFILRPFRLATKQLLKMFRF